MTWNYLVYSVLGIEPSVLYMNTRYSATSPALQMDILGYTHSSLATESGGRGTHVSD